MIVRLQDILDSLQARRSQADLDLVRRAYVYSAKVHHGQMRRSGEPYLSHPLNVAYIITQLSLDEQAVAAALLHDTLEDTLATAEELESLFGPVVRFLVEGVTKLSKINFSSGREQQAENVRKMLVAMSEDLRVILVKLADRLHNMRTLEYLEPQKREEIAQETLDIYAPLANRLGIYWIRRDLEDLAFRWLHPEKFAEIQEKLQQLAAARRNYISEVVEFLRRVLQEQNHIPVEVTGRLKHPYSIWTKMQKKGLAFEQIHDIVAFRIIVDTVEDCYRALGLIHAIWKPVIGRFKDYIAMPKINQYQSLHTTVIGPEGERVEIQIRTRQMHQIAEYGIAAHWLYKEGVNPAAAKDKSLGQFAWLRDLLAQQQDIKNPQDLLETVKVDLFTDEVFVFTPRGEVKVLPAGATALDFAYAIHTEIGHHCVGARINGKIAPLRQRLNNGDTVEILTSPHQRPRKDWLSFVKTSRARNKIRAVVRAEQRKRSEEIGRELLEKEAKRHKLNLSWLWKSGELARAAEKLQYKSTEEMLVDLGYGKLSAHRVIEQLLPEEERQQAQQQLEESKPSRFVEVLKKAFRRTTSGILVDGLDDVMVRIARCCNPLPGDRLVGIITRGRGVTVHTEECRRALDSDPQRRVEVRWDDSVEQTHAASVRVYCEDRPGLLANITTIFSEENINISKVNASALPGGMAVCYFRVQVTGLDQLKSVLRRIEKVKGVRSAERVIQ